MVTTWVLCLTSDIEQPPGLPPYQEPIRRATSPYPFVNEGNFEERNSGSTDLTDWARSQDLIGVNDT
ncbi:hypothetical protein AFLA_002057 [Aspergillus flavus NRRL3357]|nr:hypothetical protein AFLA_002057 [Aspergillus flavus NRRL3357]